MSVKSTSCLAYNLWNMGKNNENLLTCFEAEGITSPEDVFMKLRKANKKSMVARYGKEMLKEIDLGEYDFDNKTLSIAELYKKISCWEYQSCESEAVRRSRFYKAILRFATDLAVRFIIKSEEYENAEWD